MPKCVCLVLTSADAWALQAQAKARRDKAEAIALAKMGVGKVVKAARHVALYTSHYTRLNIYTPAPVALYTRA